MMGRWLLLAVIFLPIIQGGNVPDYGAEIIDVRVSPRVDDWQLWCWMADIECLQEETDPEHEYFAPPGFVVQSITIFSYVDEHTGNYYGATNTVCIDWQPPGELCFEIQGSRARIWRSEDFDHSIDVLEIFLEWEVQDGQTVNR